MTPERIGGGLILLRIAAAGNAIGRFGRHAAAPEPRLTTDLRGYPKNVPALKASALSAHSRALAVDSSKPEARIGCAPVAIVEFPQAMQRLDAVAEHRPGHTDSFRVPARRLTDMSASGMPARL